jgi:redox-sensitive bicupin YhaK (pirin superfamily)
VGPAVFLIDHAASYWPISYQDLRAADRPVIERDGARIDLISGDAHGTAGPALNTWPISGALITLEPNRSLEHRLPGPDRAFFYVLSGR